MATNFVQDDTDMLDPSFNNIRGLNLDDERTQAVLCRTKSFAKNYPRMHKREMFTAYECSSISAYLNMTLPNMDTTKEEGLGRERFAGDRSWGWEGDRWSWSLAWRRNLFDCSYDGFDDSPTVEHILSVSYQIFRDYCALMCYGLHGVTKNLAFNCKTGEVCPLMTKHKMIARTFYASHRSTIQNFDLLRSIFLYTWEHYFGVEGVSPYVEVGGDLLAVANDPPINTSTFEDGLIPDSNVDGVPRVIANDPPVNSVVQKTNKRTRDETEKDSSSDSEAVPSTPLDT
ncbi:hypothetical protein QL285_017504 [Trifolium repens]|nr:hypothetical protein QL285_017504 [Trifolium repens]